MQYFANDLANLEGVNVFELPMTKPQILDQLGKKYPKDNLWNIGIDSFNCMWTKKGSGNICSVKSPSTKKGEDFIKKYLA